MENKMNNDQLKQKNLLLFLRDFNLTVGQQLLFKNFSLDVFEDEIIGFFAPTGTGKSSLFNHIANISQKSISYVFQEPRLIPSLTVLKNVMLPLENKMEVKAARALAITWLEKLNMEHKKDELAKSLSGGEQQRTAIARAFAYACPLPELRESVQGAVEGKKLLLLDEPFASQDETNTQNIVNLIKDLVGKQHCACLVISHNLQVLQGLCTRIITQKDFCLE